MSKTYDYGRGGHVGIGTPQANPTVEAELSILIPPSIMTSVTRLTSGVAQPIERLRDYLRRMEDYVAAFDTMRLDVFGFACTASSYLVPHDEERAIIAKCEDRFGYRVITAADAIAAALDRFGAKRIQLLSPYPPAMMEAAARYWTGRGYEVAGTGCASQLTDQSDTRGIYELGSADGARVLANTPLDSIDAVLISGTGMPSLPLIADQPLAIPVLSSNLSLAIALCEAVGVTPPAVPGHLDGHAWQARCREAITAPAAE